MDYYTVKHVNSRFPVLYTTVLAEANEVRDVMSQSTTGYFVYSNTKEALQAQQAELNGEIASLQSESEAIENFLKSTDAHS